MALSLTELHPGTSREETLAAIIEYLRPLSPERRESDEVRHYIGDRVAVVRTVRVPYALVNEAILLLRANEIAASQAQLPPASPPIADLTVRANLARHNRRLQPIYGWLSQEIRKIEAGFHGASLHATEADQWLAIDNLVRGHGLYDAVAIIRGWLVHVGTKSLRRPATGLRLAAAFPTLIPIDEAVQTPMVFFYDGQTKLIEENFDWGRVVSTPEYDPPRWWPEASMPSSAPEAAEPPMSIIPKEEELSTRARRTLLVILKAVCREAEIDTTERGTAKRIEAMTMELNARVSEKTIKAILDDIPDALESRSRDGE